jgi:hypothetical protein
MKLDLGARSDNTAPLTADYSLPYIMTGMREGLPSHPLYACIAQCLDIGKSSVISLNNDDAPNNAYSFVHIVNCVSQNKKMPTLKHSSFLSLLYCYISCSVHNQRNSSTWRFDVTTEYLYFTNIIGAYQGTESHTPTEYTFSKYIIATCFISNTNLVLVS